MQPPSTRTYTCLQNQTFAISRSLERFSGARFLTTLAVTRNSATVQHSCGAVHTVDRDEDGAPDLETWPCHDDSCHARLCSDCVRRCDGCGLHHCEAHLTDFSGSKLCAVCMCAETEAGAPEIGCAACGLTSDSVRLGASDIDASDPICCEVAHA